MRRKFHGTTLVEMIIVISVLAIVFVAVMTFSMQSMKLYAKYQPLLMGQAPNNKSPQASMLLGLKRMEREMREAMFIRVGSSSTAVEIALPKTDAAGNTLLNYMVIDEQTERRALMSTEGRHVCFFLGRKDPTYPGRAIPDTANGDTIFRIVSGALTETGSDIIGGNGALAAYYDNAQVVIAGITMVSYLFSYYITDITTTTPGSTNARIVRINLTYPITQNTPTGRVTKNEVLNTQFYLRNFDTL